MEVGRDRKAVAEVAPVDEVTGAADVEHDGDLCFLSVGPHAVETDVAGRMTGRASRRDEQSGGSHLDRFVGHRGRVSDRAQRHVAGGEQPRIGRTELDHPSVVRAGRTERELDVARVLPVAEATVVERVEHELAREAEEIDGTPAVLGEERAGRGEVLAVHDLGSLVSGVLVGTMAFGETSERSIEVA